jgi:hypothetical protein
MHVVSRGIAFRAEPDSDHASCCFPGVCVLPGGRWLCTCRAAPTKTGTVGQHVLLTWSDDEGQTWTPPAAPFVPGTVAGKPGLFRAACLTALGGDEVLATLYWVDHSDPELPFFNEETEGLLDSRLFLAGSHDRGATWSAPELVDTSPYDCPTPITGPTLLLPSGEWALQFELNKHYYDAAPWQHASVIMFSADRGRTWPRHTVVASDPERRFFWWDQRPGVLRDGTLLDLFWTYDSQAATYLNIHARASLDEGRTWGELWDTGVPGQPAPPVSLADGRIAMVYVDRTGAPVIMARLSGDRGQTWPEAMALALSEVRADRQTVGKSTMQDAWAEMGKFSLGLPTTAALGEDEFLVVYYAGPETDQTDIHWVRVRM